MMFLVWISLENEDDSRTGKTCSNFIGPFLQEIRDGWAAGRLWILSNMNLHNPIAAPLNTNVLGYRSQSPIPS
jgi:hypothetical protein